MTTEKPDDESIHAKGEDVDVFFTLIAFFRDSLNDDPVGVGDWLAQGGQNVDGFMRALQAASERRLGNNAPR